MMLCQISGEPAEVPVASRKSGRVFERRLIELHIAEHGTDPTNGEPLTVDDLVPLVDSAPTLPRPPATTSIPALLRTFQGEWDSLAVETYQLRQTLVQTRQQLSTSLYQQDAAVRVIARLTKERDEARAALANVNLSVRNGTSNGDAMQVDTATLSDTILAKVDATQAGLGKSRRKRPVPEDWASADAIASYEPVSVSEPLHPGGTTLAIHEGGDLVLVGGSDGFAGVYSVSQGKALRALKGGGGAITAGLWAGAKPVISTSAGRIKVFGGQEVIGDFHAHAGEATNIALHPSGDILASVGVDKSFVLYDLESNCVLAQTYCNSALDCVTFHPDGHLLVVGGADGELKVFDVKKLEQLTTFVVGDPIKSLFFSENGTWLAVLTQNSSSISIWDIKKLAEIKRLETGGRVDSISWDYTGQYLLAGGPGGLTVEQYTKSSKQWTELMKSAVQATGVAWGRNAESIVTVSSDGVITSLQAKS